MEILILIILAVAVLAIAGVPLLPILLGAFWILEGISLLFLLFFVISTLMLLPTRRRSATFLRLEEGEQFGFYAIYDVEGVEHRNAFPTDKVLKRFYKEGSATKVRILPLRKRTIVFDRLTVGIILFGLLAFVFLSIIIGTFL